MKLQVICCRDEVTRGRCRILVTAKRIGMASAHTIDIRPEDEHYRGYRRSRYELLLRGSTVYQRRLLLLLNGRSLLAGLEIYDGRSGSPASISSDGGRSTSLGFAHSTMAAFQRSRYGCWEFLRSPFGRTIAWTISQVRPIRGESAIECCFALRIT